MRALILIAMLGACDKQGETVRPDEVPELTEEDKELSDPSPEEEKKEETTEQVDTTTKVDGGLSEKQVKAIIDEHFRPVRECFDQALSDLDSVNLDGAVVVEWSVTKEGNVQDAAIAASTFGHGEAANCIADQVRSWQFPKAKKGGTKVRYAFLPRSY